MGCSAQKMVAVNMPEDQFKKEHASAKVVELSKYRTVYRQASTDLLNQITVKFYYFTDGKLMLMDEGFIPHGQLGAVPTPL